MFLSVIDDLGERCLLRLVHSKELLEPALHHLTVAADKKPSRIDGAIRPPMFTGLSTAAGPMTHIGASSGACLIAGFVRTSTGQGTRGCGNPGRPGPPANRPGSPTRRFGRSSDRNVRQAGSRLQSSTVFGSTTDRRTGSGSTDDADAMPRNAEDQERDRIQPTALSGSPETTPTPRSRPERPSPTRTWRGDAIREPTGDGPAQRITSPRSIPAAVSASSSA